MSHLQIISSFPTVSVKNVGDMVSHISDDASFGINIDLSGTRRDDVFRFSLMNRKQARFLLTFIDPIGSMVNMMLFIRRSNGDGVSRYVSERISTDRMQGLSLIDPIHGAEGDVTITYNDESRVDVIIRVDAYN